ncbi:hypothetical protein STEG23_017904, partial [Scotinomys teguina]
VEKIIFFIIRCKNSIWNSLIPKAMGVLGSQNSAQVALWDVIFCSRVVAGAEGGQAGQSRTPSCPSSPLLGGCVTTDRAESVITKAAAAVHQEMDLVLNPHIQEPSLVSFMLQDKKSRVHPLFVWF